MRRKNYFRQPEDTPSLYAARLVTGPQDKIVQLQNGLVDYFGDDIRLKPLESLHVTYAVPAGRLAMKRIVARRNFDHRDMESIQYELAARLDEVPQTEEPTAQVSVSRPLRWYGRKNSLGLQLVPTRAMFGRVRCIEEFFVDKYGESLDLPSQFEPHVTLGVVAMEAAVKLQHYDLMRAFPRDVVPLPPEDVSLDGLEVYLDEISPLEQAA